MQKHHSNHREVMKPVVDICKAGPTPDPRKFHRMAKILNNRGCRSIAAGDYDAAIECLREALQYSKIFVSHETMSSAHCTSKTCCFKCIFQTVQDEKGKNDEQSYQDTQERTRCGSSIEEEINAKNEENQRFVYRQPFIVDSLCIDRECHMGTILSFMILFNIALANHSKSIEIFNSDINNMCRLEMLQQSLKLYELAYEMILQCKQEWLQSSHHQSRSSYSDSPSQESEQHEEIIKDAKERLFNLVNLRLMILVTNNIGEIHRLAGDTNKHHQTLEYLLNAIMFMSHNVKGDEVLSFRERDGIFENLSPLLRSKEYAAAA